MKCYAKINICLDVLGKRDDGYHQLDTIMHSIDLYDNVEIRNSNSSRVICNVDLPGENICQTALKAYCNAAGLNLNAEILVEKNIPIGAGLGGGSSDAAGVLRFLNNKYGCLNQQQMLELCADIGADVPFCYLGGSHRAEGKGELLSPAPPLPACWMLLVKPAFSVSTRELFSRVDLAQPFPRPDVEQMLAAKTLREIGSLMINSLQYFCGRIHPQIDVYIDKMRNAGALGAVMTGSGSALVGLFESKAAAQTAAEQLSIHRNTVYVLRHDCNGVYSRLKSNKIKLLNRTTKS